MLSCTGAKKLISLFLSRWPFTFKLISCTIDYGGKDRGVGLKCSHLLQISDLTTLLPSMTLPVGVSIEREPPIIIPNIQNNYSMHREGGVTGDLREILLSKVFLVVINVLFRFPFIFIFYYFILFIIATINNSFSDWKSSEILFQNRLNDSSSSSYPRGLSLTLGTLQSIHRA